VDAEALRKLSEHVIGACIGVHSYLGPGLLESAYQTCLAHELHLRGLSYIRERPLLIDYKGVRLDAAYRFDFLVEDLLLIEVKSVAGLEPIHTAQMLTYLRLAMIDVGLIVNFNAVPLVRGVRRLVRKGACFDPGVDREHP
jgi:GxxExxY protein